MTATDDHDDDVPMPEPTLRPYRITPEQLRRFVAEHVGDVAKLPPAERAIVRRFRRPYNEPKDD